MYDVGGSALAPPAGAPLPDVPGTVPVAVSIFDDQELARRGLAALLGSERVAVLRESAVDGATADGLPQPLGDVALVAAAGRGLELARELMRAQGARVLLLLDEPDDGAAALALFATGAAGAVCRRCPAERVRDAVLALAADRGVAPCTHGRPRPAGAAPRLLSERERRVAAELARGSQTEEIAAALCISPHTVRTHVRNIKRKLGARTTVQAVAIALATDELSPPR